MTKSFWHEDYWRPDAPSPDQRVPEIPEPPRVLYLTAADLDGLSADATFPINQQIPAPPPSGVLLWAARSLIIIVLAGLGIWKLLWVWP